jgi:hypothetical protein
MMAPNRLWARLCARSASALAQWQALLERLTDTEKRRARLLKAERRVRTPLGPPPKKLLSAWARGESAVTSSLNNPPK